MSTSVTSCVRSQSASATSSVVRPSNPEYAASCSPLRKIASNGCGSRLGWNASPSVPTLQCTGQLSREVGLARTSGRPGRRGGPWSRRRGRSRARAGSRVGPVVEQLGDVAGDPGAAARPAASRPRRSRSARRRRSVPASWRSPCSETSQPAVSPRQPGDHVGDDRVPQPPLVLAGAEVGGDGRRRRAAAAAAKRWLASSSTVLGAAAEVERRQRSAGLGAGEQLVEVVASAGTVPSKTRWSSSARSGCSSTCDVDRAGQARRGGVPLRVGEGELAGRRTRPSRARRRRCPPVARRPGRARGPAAAAPRRPTSSSAWPCASSA